ncbi:VWA domain-containing protein [Palleronia rufa]|uniref:VWA domain-containing protein n=1 Tax=Palleronia rufa TaxID=1530186 RepID=UPI000568F48D|nr:VWA domain-containing protein [Palleronia rufa]
MIDLATPLALLALPVPLLARLLPRRAGRGAALILPAGTAAALLDRAAPSRAGRTRGQAGWWLAWACLVLALAGPRQLVPVDALPVSGRDLAISLDLSGSMVRDDFALDGAPMTRLDAVKRVGAEFARRRAGDRLALILFGSEAYYAAPFTFDTEAVARRIETAEIGISGRATNISDGLGLALKRLARSDARTRVVVLLSDGVNNAGATNPRGVAELAASMGVRVHTIALGPRDVAGAEAGERGVVDAATLRSVAEISGGEAFRVRTLGDLETVAEALDRLEPTAGDGLAAEVFRPLWLWPALLGTLTCLWLGWRGEAQA